MAWPVSEEVAEKSNKDSLSGLFWTVSENSASSSAEEVFHGSEVAPSSRNPCGALLCVAFCEGLAPKAFCHPVLRQQGEICSAQCKAMLGGSHSVSLAGPPLMYLARRPRRAQSR